jgi:hypothetical protein
MEQQRVHQDDVAGSGSVFQDLKREAVDFLDALGNRAMRALQSSAVHRSRRYGWRWADFRRSAPGAGLGGYSMNQR